MRADLPLPHFGTLIGDGQGGVWAARYEVGAIPGARRYDVFSPAGEWIGEVDFETPVRILDVRGDRVLCMTYDSMEVQGVSEFRVGMGPPGG